MKTRPAVLLFLTACQSMPSPDPTYRDDVAFLRKHVQVIELGAADGGPRVAIVPAWQGRVVTSAVDSGEGGGFGWLNRELIASNRLQPHMNAYGGEDRLWIGPEGGQFGIFFAPGVPFDLENWQTPAAIDSDPYEIVSSDDHEIVFRHEARFTNWSGTEFQVRIDRSIALVPESSWRQGLKIPKGVRAVVFESRNRITNIGSDAWTKEAGLLSIWTIGMFRPSNSATVVLPYEPDGDLGPIVNAAYFGEVPRDRLSVGDTAVFFRGDGQFRSKIGIPPRRTKGVLGAYDPERRLLTVVQCDLSPGVTEYVNSMWEQQSAPYGGDAIHSYNDGPPGPGMPPLGPFYELESSSPAAALTPGADVAHRHRTLHFVGDAALLDPIARALLGVDLATVDRVFR